MPSRPCSDKERESLTHVTFTLDKDWDPYYLDCEGHINNEELFDTQSFFPDVPDSKTFNKYG